MTALDPDLLLRAYSIGVFPMADGRGANDVFWVEPRQRGVLPLDRFHLSRSLARTLRSGRLRTTADQAFDRVLAMCAEQTETRADTWINPAIETAYRELHRRGHAHSIETWDAHGALVGGLYGVRLGAAFFGESMFSRADDASKVALAHLTVRLRAGGFTLLDCQFITDHLASLGAIEIGRDAYVSLLDAALGAGAAGVPAGDFGALDRVAEARDVPAAAAEPATIVSGPISGCFIAQALAHTS